ncbi:MAG: mevalonate kinase [Gammaproteobacteria bacterium]|nr:mevalonate kinase [Gammaproteobacteria bacterium]
MQLKASAPGSLMLLGEYGVLYGKQALVCALDKRMTVTLTPLLNDEVQIESTLGQYQSSLSQLKIVSPFEYVLSVIKYHQGRMKRGFHLKIESNFSHQVGFGSSAAVTVATLSALYHWFNIKISPLDLIRQAKMIIHQVQGIGSGADIAASVYGGIVGYQTQPLSVEKFAFTHPITALHTGYKTKTADVVKKVQDYFTSHPHLFRVIHAALGQCALDGMQHIRKENWMHLGEVMNIQQGIMESLGVSDFLLHQMVNELRQAKQIHGAKISGAGLGDCVIGLGALPSDYTYPHPATSVTKIPVEIAIQGVHCEKV